MCITSVKTHNLDKLQQVYYSSKTPVNIVLILIKNFVLQWFYLSSQIALTGEIFGTRGHKPNAPWNLRLCTNKNLHSNYCSIMSFISLILWIYLISALLALLPGKDPLYSYKSEVFSSDFFSKFVSIWLSCFEGRWTMDTNK